jgi:hypothetical protein
MKTPSCSFLVILLTLLVSCDNQVKTVASGPISDLVMDTTGQVIFWHFEDTFSFDEQHKLKTWITYADSCAQKVLGKYPFDPHYTFHRVDSAYQAVVFGHTGRNETVHGVHFYVDPAYPMKDFMDDWIGPHEISHLALPKLGKANRWFFEGFATYISRAVMVEMGTITQAEADSTIQKRISDMTWAFEKSTSNFITVADSLVDNHHLYPELYWGGGSYWHKAEQRLQEQGKNSLVNVIKYFQIYCHTPLLTLDETVACFDRVSQSTIFSDLLEEYRTLPAREILVDYEVMEEKKLSVVE